MATRGRPPIYKPEFAKQAEKLCALGATDAELADFFGVHVATIHRWRHEYTEFCDSIKTAKEIADARVERSLYQRAMGYEHDETDIRVIQNEIVTTDIRKHYPPDSTAMIFWLKNRKPAEWRDKVDSEITGPGGGPLQVAEVVRRVV